MKAFKVGTFPGPPVCAYTTWYSSVWDGCVEYLIDAESGKEAKREAIRLRKLLEKGRKCNG